MKKDKVMEIQSLSVFVPTPHCVNNCKYCVSRMHYEEYKRSENINEIGNLRKRLLFARENSCNTVVLTGRGEILQNKEFLELFAAINHDLSSPFWWIEMQTSGVMLTDENLKFLRDKLEVSTISLSLADIFDSKNNAEIEGIPSNLYFEIDELCFKIKKYGFNLRLSLNMSNAYLDSNGEVDTESILKKASEFGADQVTFRKLYYSSNGSKADRWVKENAISDEKLNAVYSFIVENAKPIAILPFGATKYGYKGMSIVIDNDCMSETIVKNVYKYLILREDLHLYSKWDDKASLIF